MQGMLHIRSFFAEMKTAQMKEEILSPEMLKNLSACDIIKKKSPFLFTR